MTSKRVLVTGAAGFVGAVLSRRLVADGHDVHLLLRPGTDAWRLAGLEARTHAVDLADEAGVRRALSAVRPEWVFHLAAHGAYASQKDRGRIVEANVLGTMNLLEAALELGLEAFVNTGSSSEYGLTDHAPGEDERAEPNSVYACAKLFQTQFVRHAARESGAQVKTLRLYSVYGPYEAPTRLIPKLLVRGLAGRLPPLVSPDVARDFVYVDDVVDAYERAARTSVPEPGAVFNVGTGRQVSIREAVAQVRDLLGIEAEPDWGSMPNRSWDTETWRADPAKIGRELGWSATTPFEAGLKRTLDWLRGDPARLERYRAAVL